MNSGNNYLQAFCLSGMMNYTRYFFKARFGRKFIVNDHHIKICDAIDKVVRGETKKLIINIAPRYSKTEIVVKNFISYGIALNPSSKFLHLSYSDDLANDNSDEIREIVKSEEYRRIFPYVSIKKTSDSKKKWYTESGGGVYAASTGGQVTGFGAGELDKELTEEIKEMPSLAFSGAMVIDDPIKPEDALSDNIRESVNQRFETTIRNRVNSTNTPIVIVMQRLHENDLCGYLMKIEPGEWEVLSLPAINYENGEEKPLWEFKHTLEDLYKIRNANSYVFETQYMQNPTPLEGLLYGTFKTYETIPFTQKAIRKNYTDTADTGSDYLCSIDYLETEIGNFILDILFTQKAMEYTEVETAKMMTRDGIEKANIESNNGGRGFARNVESQMRKQGNTKTEVNWFHQSGSSESKATRIFTLASQVMNMTYFPSGWETRFPEFASQVKGYRKQGRNAHDDAPDVLSGMIEKRSEYNIRYYDSSQIDIRREDIHADIHPSIDGKSVGCSYYYENGQVYIIDCLFDSGKQCAPNELRHVFPYNEKQIHIEIPIQMKQFADDYRDNFGTAIWIRKQRSHSDRLSFIESYKSIIQKFRFPKSNESCKSFISNMVDYDGRYNHESMYVLACIADRLKKARVIIESESNSR